MQNLNVNKGVAKYSNYTCAENLRVLAEKINRKIITLDAERQSLQMEIDGFGIEMEYSAELKEYIGGERGEVLHYPTDEVINITALWLLEDDESKDLPLARQYLNNLLN